MIKEILQSKPNGAVRNFNRIKGFVIDIIIFNLEREWAACRDPIAILDIEHRLLEWEIAKRDAIGLAGARGERRFK